MMVSRNDANCGIEKEKRQLVVFGLHNVNPHMPGAGTPSEWPAFIPLKRWKKDVMTAGKQSLCLSFVPNKTKNRNGKHI